MKKEKMRCAITLQGRYELSLQNLVGLLDGKEVALQDIRKKEPRSLGNKLATVATKS